MLQVLAIHSAHCKEINVFEIHLQYLQTKPCKTEYKVKSLTYMALSDDTQSVTTAL